MTHDPSQTDDLLARYADGLLEGPEREAFEARLAGEPALRAQLEVERRISAGLRANFQPPAIRVPGPGALPKVGGGARSGGRLRVKSRFTIYAAAAALLLVTLAGVSIFNSFFPSTQRFIPLTTVYERLVSGGFQPQFVCETDEEFAAAVRNRFGIPLLVGASPDVQVLGWAYSSSYDATISDRTLILMATVKGREVLVFMDNASNDRRPKYDRSAGLHLHKRTVDGLVLYELSPFNTPALLPLSYRPADPVGMPKKKPHRRKPDETPNSR